MTSFIETRTYDIGGIHETWPEVLHFGPLEDPARFAAFLASRPIA
jgi:hypothetical protein